MDQSGKLATVLAEFAHTLGRDFHVQGILDHLVRRIVDVLPVTGAGVMMMGPHDELHFVAASNDVILKIEGLQNELREGPCLEAYRSGEAVSVPDLSLDERFPAFSPRAFASGLAAVFTFPMTLDGRRFGALDLYRDETGPLAHDALDAAQVLADVAAAYIHNARDRANAADSLDQLRHRSLHDPLTGLPNRTLLKERLEQAVARTRRSHELLAVLFVDLDRFKAVNDTWGHHIGDQVLIAVAQQLRSVLRSGDTLARLSGDEFVILCEGVESPQLAENVAARVVAALDSKIEIDGVVVGATASVGLAFCGAGEDVPETLLQDADFAMYQAKQAGGARHQVIDPASRLAADSRGRLAAELQTALERDELDLAYQPVVDVHDGRVTGVEGLLRWNHPVRGWLMPREILTVVEQDGLGLRLGEWVLTRACRDLRHWRPHRDSIASVAVNVSPSQVMAPGFASMVRRVLDLSGVDPANLRLEVTESALLEDGQRALTVLEQLKRLGLGLVLDDFGTGYSSLLYLRQFPFDSLKIDQTCITSLADDDGARMIVTAIIELAHGLQLSVVAEGVETEEQLDDVVALGTDQAQGFHFSRPMLPEQIDRRIFDHADRPVRLPLPAPHTALTRDDLFV